MDEGVFCLAVYVIGLAAIVIIFGARQLALVLEDGKPDPLPTLGIILVVAVAWPAVVVLSGLLLIVALVVDLFT